MLRDGVTPETIVVLRPAAAFKFANVLRIRQHEHTGVNAVMSHVVTICNMCIGTYLGKMVMFSVINDTVGLCAVLRR